VAAGEDPQPLKEAMLEEVYRMGCVLYGEPPRSFSFEYRDKDGNYHCERELTGRSFYEKYLSGALEDYVTVTNHPTHGLPMNLYYVFHYMGSMPTGT
jgi:bleomycin hydrolase